MSSSLVVRRAVVAVLAVVSLLVAGLGSALPSSAAGAPAAPDGLTPDGTTVDGVPVLTWNRVRGAVRYDVEVSASDSFSNSLWTTTTSNRRATPTVQLPAGRVYWRVRSIGGEGASPWRSASWSRTALAGPTPLAPADGAVLDPPAEPTMLSWEPRRGAFEYTVEVSTDPRFVDASKVRSYRTRTSSFVVPDPVVATDYYWRVRADLGTGVATQWSTIRRYRMAGLDRPLLQSPVDGATTSVVDVVLDWEPVMGARTYNLQISTDRNFNTVDHTATGVIASRYSPSATLNNDQYYWRVAPVDVEGNTLDWADVDVWEFRRHWPDQPTLQYPADNATVGNPFFFQWSPVRNASSYRLEISTSREFTDSARFGTCTTVQTTYTPTAGGNCFPDALGTYFWRVVAIDGPVNVQGDAISAQVRRFTYNPGLVTPTSPAPGSTVPTPTLRWEPVPGATAYDVELTQNSNNRLISTRTTGTSWTPREKLVAGELYRWRVRTVSGSNRVGPWLLPQSQPQFTAADPAPATAAAPALVTPDGQVSDRFPTLEWSPVVGAATYRIRLRSAGTIPWYTLNDRFVYGAGEDTGSAWIVPDTYEWTVEAYNAAGQLMSESPQTRTFVVAGNRAVTGQRVALEGIASGGPTTSCAKALDPTLPDGDQQCMGLRATPVLRWDAEPNTAQYKVYISRDQQLTNVLATYTTEQTMFIPPSALIDSQAGSAFYWHVQPCRAPATCRPLQHAQHAFNKISAPVELLTPAQDTPFANSVTFTWRDYLQTNTTAPRDASGVGSVAADVEAMMYRIQVDDDPNFQSPLEQAKVDQTTYTSPSTTYPEGPLYWRVQAFDGTDNPLTWSTPGRFTKRSPAVTLTSPTANGETSGSEPLRWEPLAYAARYEVEVYKNADTIGQNGNLVYSGSSKQVAITPPTPFAVSPTSYTWRVRPLDAGNRPGPWSELGAPGARFRVVGQAPTLTGPQPDTLQPSNDLLFSWTSVDGAAEYRFERRLVGESGLAETVRTASLAWAPSEVGDGLWEWRVLALDNTGTSIGSSPWARFSVDRVAPTVRSSRPGAPLVKRSASLKVTFSEPVAGATRSTVTLKRVGSRKKLNATVVPNGDGTVVTLNPSASLKKGLSYDLRLTAGIHDGAGNALIPYLRTFTAK